MSHPMLRTARVDWVKTTSSTGLKAQKVVEVVGENYTFVITTHFVKQCNTDDRRENTSNHLTDRPHRLTERLTIVHHLQMRHILNM